MHLMKRLSWLGGLGNSGLKSEYEQSKLMRRFGKKGKRKGQMDMPSGIAVSSEGDIVIADTENHRVQIFSPEGHLKRKFGEKGLLPDQFCYPKCLLITPGDQNIIVTDSANSAVKVFDYRGKLLHVIERNSEFRLPHGIAQTKDGFLIVTDIFYHKVLVFYNSSSSSSSSSTSSCTPSSSSSSPSSPSSSSSLSSSSSWELSHSFGTYGESDTQLDHPYHVTSNVNKQIVVSDYGNASIKIFHFEGKLLRCFGCRDFRLPADDLIQLSGVTVDGDDNTIVLCNREVYILAKNGRLWEVLTERDMGAGGASGGGDRQGIPQDVAVTSAGCIYVINAGCGPDVSEVCVFRYNKDDYRSLNTLAYYAISI